MAILKRIKQIVIPDQLETIQVDQEQPSYLIPAALVTTLFFLWGFSYGLLDTLNKHFRNALGLTTTETTYMQVAYFGAYFVISPIAGLVLKRIGYKRTIVIGLLFYVLGAFCFYPSATGSSFGGFVGSLFVIATGLATLENCANTYIAIVGSRRWASFRINLAQGFNGVGTTISPVIASYAFFGGNESNDDGNLDSVKWTYVGVGCGVFVIMLFFCLVKIPEFDEETQMALEAEQSGEVIRRASMASPHLWLGAITQFIYTGVQVAIASLFMFYSAEVGHFKDSYGAILLALGQMCFTMGRFIGAPLMRYVKAEFVLAGYAVGAVISCIFLVAVHTPKTTYVLLVLMFFESVQFPTIFALATKDLGRNYKRGAPFVIMGVAGGAVFPPVMAILHDNRDIHVSFAVPLGAFVVVFLYAIWGSKWIRYVDDELHDVRQVEVVLEKKDVDD